MSGIITITLYGATSSRERARSLLENQPQVRRVDPAQGSAKLRLFLSGPLTENDLVVLLAGSEISGFNLS